MPGLCRDYGREASDKGMSKYVVYRMYKVTCGIVGEGPVKAGRLFRVGANLQREGAWYMKFDGVDKILVYI